MLDETRLEELRRQYVKIGVIDWEGHQLVFRRPSRDEVHHYRMQRDGSPDERGGASDLLSTKTMVAFDGETDPNRARLAYDAFLGEYPMFCSALKPQGVLSILSGLIESEAAAALGKGATVRSAPPPTTPTA